jgi:hypothetical protein
LSRTLPVALQTGDLDNDGNEESCDRQHGRRSLPAKKYRPVSRGLAVGTRVSSGRDAIGARITVTANGRKQVDEVRSGGSFISQNDFRLHFGLGKATAADVSVRWQDGKVETFLAIAAGQL